MCEERKLPPRPASLTYEHAEKCLPKYEVNPEWQAKKDAGTLPEGIMGMSGMLRHAPAEEALTQEEAQWILAVDELNTWRGTADVVFFGNSNQIWGRDIVEMAGAVAVPKDSEGRRASYGYPGPND